MEYQDELGLNLYDMDMRDYDPAIGRWLGIDPVTHFEQSPYMAMNGDPVYWADPSGADGVVRDLSGTVYGLAGQSTTISYSGYGGNNVFWGTPDALYEQSWEGHNGSQTTTDKTEISNILKFYSRTSGGYILNWWGTDTNGQYAIGCIMSKARGGSDRIKMDKYGGLESYRQWRDYPLYHKGETWLDRFARNINSSHIDIMLDFGGGGYNMFGGYGKVVGAVTASENEIVQATTRIGRDGNAVEILYQNGDIIDINVARVKMWTPNTHPKAPPGSTNPVKFDNFIPGSKGYKRLPTSAEIDLLNSFFK